MLQLAGIHQEFTIITAGQRFLLQFWCLCLSTNQDFEDDASSQISQD